MPKYHIVGNHMSLLIYCTHHLLNSFSQFTITATGRTIRTDLIFSISNNPDRKLITCIVLPNLKIHQESYMSAHVLLNLLKELRKSNKLLGLLGILSFFPNKFNKFNNTGA